MTEVAVWLGTAPPVRTIRWLDGAIAAAAKFGAATAVAAGDATWLDLAADRANRAGLASVGVETPLALDYLGWAQVMAAVARQIGATTILVDEASRPERFPEVAAIAELLDAAQLTHVVALAPDGNKHGALIHASRAAGPWPGPADRSPRGALGYTESFAALTGGAHLQTCRVRGAAVLGVRIAGPSIDEYPTPMPSAAMRRLDLPSLGLDPAVLGHRALPPRSGPAQRRTVERVAEYLAVHAAPPGRRRSPTQGS